MKQATGGGHPVKHDVHNYQQPKGPTEFHHQGPGLAGHINHGQAHKPVGRETGKPGIGSTDHGNCGSQGRH